jgi:hypothetical protein
VLIIGESLCSVLFQCWVVELETGVASKSIEALAVVLFALCHGKSTQVIVMVHLQPIFF